MQVVFLHLTKIKIRMKSILKPISMALLATMLLGSCTVVRQDEVAVKRKLGRVKDKVYGSGPVVFNPFLVKVIRTPIRTVNLAVSQGLPSREGLTVQSDISILYRVQPDKLKMVIQQVGLNYEQVLIFPVFRSAAADICAKFDAKDMHSAKRAEIEKQIKERMMFTLNGKGFEIEEVLMKSISLPPGLTKAIEEKLNAEQEAQRMEFVKDRERKEADRKIIQANADKETQIIAAEAVKRKIELEAEGRANALRIEAEGQKKANEFLNANLSPMILKLKSIEAFEQLSKSNNSKVIITDGKTPFLSLPDMK
jgi:regulator of protease activity HflC (stomatin/prohibitin superfamily)